MWLMLFSRKHIWTARRQRWSQLGCVMEDRNYLIEAKWNNWFSFKQLSFSQLCREGCIRNFLLAGILCDACSQLYRWNQWQSTQGILKSLFVQSASRLNAVLVASQRAFRALLHPGNSWSDLKSPWKTPTTPLFTARAFCKALATSPSVRFHHFSNGEELFSTVPSTVQLLLHFTECCTSSPVSAIAPETSMRLTQEKNICCLCASEPSLVKAPPMNCEGSTLTANRCQCRWNQFMSNLFGQLENATGPPPKPCFSLIPGTTF